MPVTAPPARGRCWSLRACLRWNPLLAQKIELVFFDGEEAVRQWSDTDGIYGSRYYARQLRESKRASQFKFGILWDMIGKKKPPEHHLLFPRLSPPELAKGIFAAADALGSRGHFTYLDRDITDDNKPLNLPSPHIPSIDLIDF